MFDERCPRQDRYEPPSEFPQTSPFTGIVHHLSGPNKYAHAQASPQLIGRLLMRECLSNHFHYAHKFDDPCTYTCVRLLGPCFKTGRIEQFNHNLQCQVVTHSQLTAHICWARPGVSQHNLVLNFRLKSEHCKRHLNSQSRSTMSQELSPLSNI